jgi:hypothetical protein
MQSVTSQALQWVAVIMDKNRGQFWKKFTDLLAFETYVAQNSQE